MANFFRVLRLVLRYKWTLAASTFTAIMVALLWGANIGGAFPAIQIIVSGQSVQDWLKTDIQTTGQSIANLTADIAAMEAKIAAAGADQKHALQLDLNAKRKRLTADERHLARSQWIQPYANAWLPTKPYATLVVILMVISLGYILKNIFLIFDSILVDRLSNLATLDLRKKFYRRTLRMDLSSFGEARVS